VTDRLLFCAALLIAAASVAQAAQQGPQNELKKVECLTAARGAELLGQHGCVAGRVYSATVAKNGNQHLSLCPPHQGCSFHAVVTRRDSAQVGDVTYLRGKVIALVGDVTDFRGHPRIVIRDRQQIHVAADNPPPEFDASQSKPSTKGNRGGKKTNAW
jgi:hypothetical protein